MAITKITFSNTTSRATMGTDLYNFLHTYGADYFDSVVQGTNTVDCIIDDVTVLSFKCTNNISDTVRTVGNSTLVTFPTVDTDAGWYIAGYVTSKGLYIQCDPTANYNRRGVCIFRDTGGNTAFSTVYLDRYGTSSTQNSRSIQCVFKLSSAVNVGLSAITNSPCFTNFVALFAKDSGVASLAPVALDPTAESIADGFYYVPMSPYVNREGRLSVGGKEYVYNGLYALEG